MFMYAVSMLSHTQRNTFSLFANFLVSHAMSQILLRVSYRYSLYRDATYSRVYYVPTLTGTGRVSVSEMISCQLSVAMRWEHACLHCPIFNLVACRHNMRAAVPEQWMFSYRLMSHQTTCSVYSDNNFHQLLGHMPHAQGELCHWNKCSPPDHQCVMLNNPLSTMPRMTGLILSCCTHDFLHHFNICNVVSHHSGPDTKIITKDCQWPRLCQACLSNLTSCIWCSSSYHRCLSAGCCLNWNYYCTCRHCICK